MLVSGTFPSDIIDTRIYILKKTTFIIKEWAETIK